jgi:hypothetical protein
VPYCFSSNRAVLQLLKKDHRCKPAMMSLRSLLLAVLPRIGPGLHCFTGPALTNVRSFCTAAATDKTRTALLYCVNQVRCEDALLKLYAPCTDYL